MNKSNQKADNREKKARQRERQRGFIEWLYVLKDDGTITTSAEAVISKMMTLPIERQRQIKRLLGD